MAQESSYHRDDLKAELIEKGVKLLDEEGYDNFSLRKVAKACNVSHAAPYRHFKNKEELIAEIALEAERKFSQSLQAAVDQYPNDPNAQLREMGCAYISFFAENPEYLRLIFFSDINKRIKESLQASGHNCQEEQASAQHPFQILYRTVKRYREVAQKDSLDQESLLLYCWGLVHGISILRTQGDFAYSGDFMELMRKIIWSDSFLSY